MKSAVWVNLAQTTAETKSTQHGAQNIFQLNLESSVKNDIQARQRSLWWWSL